MFDLGQRLARGIRTLEQFFGATVMLGVGMPPRFCGSGFFVADVDPGRPVVGVGQSEDAFLVTARHVIAEALHRRTPIFVRFPRHRQDPIDVQLPTEGWTHSESGADVSVLRWPELRYETRVGGCVFTVITRGQFFVHGWAGGYAEFEVGDRVRLFGLWHGETTYPQIIIRTGTMALATIEPVQFESGQTRAYLVDSTVTRGMSGGPTCITRGEGTAENPLVGLIYGYWPLSEAELDGPLGAEGETEEQRARRTLREDVDRLNTRLAIIVPVHEIARTMVQAGWRE